MFYVLAQVHLYIISATELFYGETLMDLRDQIEKFCDEMFFGYDSPVKSIEECREDLHAHVDGYVALLNETELKKEHFNGVEMLTGSSIGINLDIVVDSYEDLRQRFEEYTGSEWSLKTIAEVEPEKLKEEISQRMSDYYDGESLEYLCKEVDAPHR